MDTLQEEEEKGMDMQVKEYRYAPGAHSPPCPVAASPWRHPVHHLLAPNPHAFQY